MGRLISICVVCRKELNMKGRAFRDQSPASPARPEEVLYSHGICHECGVRVYGTELMEKAGPGPMR